MYSLSQDSEREREIEREGDNENDRIEIKEIYYFRRYFVFVRELFYFIFLMYSFKTYNLIFYK